MSLLFSVISVTSLKPGTCPVASGIGICVQGCDTDEDCSGTRKCVIIQKFNIKYFTNSIFQTHSVQTDAVELVKNQYHQAI